MPTTKKHYVAYIMFPTQSNAINSGFDWTPNPSLLANPDAFLEAEIVEPARYIVEQGGVPIFIADIMRQTPEWKMGPDGKRIATGRDMLSYHFLGWCAKIGRPEIAQILIDKAKKVRAMHRHARAYLYGGLYADWRAKQTGPNDTAAMSKAYRLMKSDNAGDWKLIFTDQLSKACPFPFNGIIADAASQHMGSAYLAGVQTESHIPTHDAWRDALAKLGIDFVYEANVMLPGYTAPDPAYFDRNHYFLGNNTENQLAKFQSEYRTEQFRHPVCPPEFAEMPNLFACDTWGRVKLGQPFPFAQWALMKRLTGAVPIATRFWWDANAAITPVDLRGITTSDERQRVHYRDCLAASKMENA